MWHPGPAPGEPRDSQSRVRSPQQPYWIQAMAPYLSPSEPKALSPAFRSRPPGRTRLQSGSWQPHELLGWPAWLTQEATLNALIRLPWDWFNKMSAEMGRASGGSRQTQRWQRCLCDDHIHPRAHTHGTQHRRGRRMDAREAGCRATSICTNARSPAKYVGSSLCLDPLPEECGCVLGTKPR